MQDRIDLPPLDEERIGRMEERIVAAHGRERWFGRRRVTTIIGTAAAVLVVSGVIGAAVGGGGRGVEASGSDSVIGASGGAAFDGDLEERSSAPLDPSVELDGELGSERGTVDGREIETAATATVRVASVRAAVESIGREAETLGGYVETSSTTGDGGDAPVAAPHTPETSPEEPGATAAGAITIRVPAERLSAAVAALDGVGEVVTATTDRRDVTTEAIDLRARIDAARASVDRLTALIGQAASTADLIAAESALAERQAELESMQQQLTALEGRVALSSLAVTLVPEAAVVEAEPAGFLDGLLAGWNGLVGAVNGIVVGLGFLLPWLVVGGVVTVVVVAVRRRRRRTG